MKNESSSNSIAISIFGLGGVGKSALTLRFMYDEFVEEYEPTKSDTYRKTIKVNDAEYQMSIFDTAGQEDYDFLKDNFIVNSHGFLCVFSLTDRESFNELDPIIEKIQRIKGTNHHTILVGNKLDIIQSGEKRVVSEEDAKFKIDKYNLKYLETSAKDNTNVNDVFMMIAKDITKNMVTQGPSVKIEKLKNEKKCLCF